MAAAEKTEQDFNRLDVKIAVYAGLVQERLAKRQSPQTALVRGRETRIICLPFSRARRMRCLFRPSPRSSSSVVLRTNSFVPSASKPLSSTLAAIGVRKGDADFLNYLNTSLAFQRDDGWLDDRAIRARLTG
jgi:hypothetical protein